MSLKSHATRSLVATGAVAFAALGVAAPANAAIDKQLVYQCKFPIIAPGTISMDIQGPDIPSKWPTGLATPKWAITAKATLNAPIPAAMSAIDGLASIEGKATAKADLVLTRADGTFNVAANVTMTVPKTPFTPTDDEEATLDVNASGSAPSQYQDDPATGKIVLRSIALNMIARDTTGKALQLAPVTKDWEGKAWADSDNNPDTFDVLCRLDPATPGQTLDLADIAFISEPSQAPSAPTEVDGTVPGKDFLDLKWGASTDADGDLKGYNVSVQELNGELEPVGTPKTSFVNAPATSTKVTGLKAGTAYDVTIIAEDNGGLKSDPLVLPLNTLGNDPVAPTAPANLKGTGALTSVDLTWDAAIDADGTIKEYRVYQNGGATPVKTVTGTSAKIEGLTSDTAYKFKVVAVDNTDLVGPASDEITVSTTKPAVNVPPSKVAGVTGTSTQTAVALKWDVATDTDGTIKEYRVFQNGGATPVKTVTGTSVDITGLTAGTEYTFTVVAVDDDNDAGAASDAYKIKTLAPDNVAPSKVAGVTGTSTQTAVALKWDAATDTDGTIKEYRVFQNGGATPVKTVTGTSVDITGLTAGTEYTFTVVAVDDDNATGAASDAYKIKTLAPDNVAPSKVAGVTGTSTQTAVALKWDAATDTDGTIKEYRVFQNGGATPVKTVTGTSVDITGLTAGTEYTFTVVAVDDDNATGPASDAYKIKTVGPDNVAPSKVLNVSGTPGLTSVALKWDAATDTDGTIKEYRVYQNGGATPVKTVTGTSVDITGLASDTEYTFTVVAVDDDNAAGAASDAAKVKTLKPTPNQAPSKVAGVSGTATANSVSLKWTAATDSDGTVKEYRVFQNGGATPVKTVTGTSVDISGLAAETEYTFTVVAVDNLNLAGAASDAYKISTIKGEQPNEQAPVVSSVIGRTAFANIGGVALVSGKNLSKIQKVTVGTKNASYSSLGSTLALVVLPPLKKGSYDLTITTAGGTSNATKITYISLW